MSQIEDNFFDVEGSTLNQSLSTEYTVTGLVRGQDYGFRYRAINANGGGVWSAITYITAATIPSAPANAPEYVSSTNTQIVLKLSRSYDDGGAAIADYELEIDQGFPPTALITSGISTFTKVTQYVYSTHWFSYTIDSTTLSLTPGKLYRFRYRSKNKMGYSPYSDTQRIGLGALPSAVSGLSRRAEVAGEVAWNSNTTIGLSWTAVTGDTLPIKEYVIYMSDQLQATMSEIYRGTFTYTKIENLVPGATYNFKVSAINFNGEGALSIAIAKRSCVALSKL